MIKIPYGESDFKTLIEENTSIRIALILLRNWKTGILNTLFFYGHVDLEKACSLAPYTTIMA